MLRFQPQASARQTWPEYLAARAHGARDPRLARFFAAGTPEPHRPVAEAPLVALDMETTGLDPDRHAIVSIGVVPFTQQRIRFAQRGYWVVRPPRPLSEASIALHRITHSEVARAPDLGEILGELLAALAGSLVVVHYRNVERPFLDSAIRARLGEGLQFPVVDTMELEARHRRHSGWARLKRLFGQPPVSLRLNDCRVRHHLPSYPGHHALSDALATAELLQAQLAHWYRPTTPVSALWV